MRFFFYGTLMAGSGNAVARGVHARLSAGVAATVAGRLYGIADPAGWYPALAWGAGGAVRGFVHEAGAGFSEVDLAVLDGWEGYAAEAPETSEYRRCEVAVTLADGARVMAQAYVWAGALPEGAEAIVGGDFAAFLRQRGVKAFGGGD